MVHIIDLDARFAQAVADGAGWERHRMLLATEALFLNHRDHLTIRKKRCGGVVTVAVKAQDVQCLGSSVLPFRYVDRIA